MQSMDQIEGKIDELFIYMENELPPITEKQWKIIDTGFSDILNKSSELQIYISCL